MGFLELRAPTALRSAMMAAGEPWDNQISLSSSSPLAILTSSHDSHPPVDHLVLLIFGAVLEVVCVSLPGYVIARLGHFDADKQKFLANLNVMLFTPCLIFTKLASQLNAEKLIELGVIPIIFVIQTLVSYLVSRGVSKCFGFNRRASNFVTAMGVFGNSNSLPISLVISLSQTLKGLHWDRIPKDNDEEVAARGILYLMIFQQLGQLVRWSWGYHVLLAPKDKYDEYADETIEEGRYGALTPDGSTETQGLLEGVHPDTVGVERPSSPTHTVDSAAYEPAGRTPIAGSSRHSPHDSEDEGHDGWKKPYANGVAGVTSVDGTLNQFGDNEEELNRILSFPRIRNNDEAETPTGVKGLPVRISRATKKYQARVTNYICNVARQTYDALPRPVQSLLSGIYSLWQRVYNFLWEFMNPPLWAMLLAILVASIKDLQELFFKDDTFVKTSVTAALRSSAGVAVPLILVVLGANLARNTQNHDTVDPEEKEIGKKLLIASLISRMLLPTLIMAPILAVFAKYVPVSILDDPIFVVVCFLLTGAPSALQLAQICQINNVYEGVMGRILFQSYVIWILPSTLVLVMCALEVLEWAA
ncbi:membrane transport protein-domain-containing protein [Apiosordaria backusii]|uniref:Membrane transport protein-domain-containing protein n=1 Tax=Apiosordaria backusii TaxID=314023 RepID=A0AA40EF00_9PEZI|nr:membrane transport protein-domain-containing protein [Apiosordaria backusii]